jgi:hypothetical protein
MSNWPRIRHVVSGELVQLSGDLDDRGMSWNREIWIKLSLPAMDLDDVAISTPQQSVTPKTIDLS